MSFGDFSWDFFDFFERPHFVLVQKRDRLRLGELLLRSNQLICEVSIALIAFRQSGYFCLVRNEVRRFLQDALAWRPGQTIIDAATAILALDRRDLPVEPC